MALRDCGMQIPYSSEQKTYHEVRNEFKAQSCLKTRETGRFSVYRGPPYEISENTRPLFSNNDGDYLQYCTHEDDVGKFPIFRVTGVLTPTSQSLYAERGVQVSDWEDYEARYVSFTSTDAAAPTVSFKTFCDEDIRRFYQHIPNWNGSYSIIIAPDTEMASGCGMFNEAEDMFLPLIKPDTLYPRSPGVMYREILPKTQRLAEEIGDHVQGPSVGYLKKQCYENEEFCYEKDAQRSIMGDYFPEIEVYTCPDGDITQLRQVN